MKTKNFNRYSYQELLSAATAPGAEQIDIDTLGAWFENYGLDYWNGESFDASAPGEPTGYRLLEPVYEWDEELDQGKIIRFEFR